MLSFVQRLFRPRPQDAKRQRIEENAAILQHLMRGAMAGGAEGCSAWLSGLHWRILLAQAGAVHCASGFATCPASWRARCILGRHCVYILYNLLIFNNKY